MPDLLSLLSAAALNHFRPAWKIGKINHNFLFIISSATSPWKKKENSNLHFPKNGKHSCGPLFLESPTARIHWLVSHNKLFPKQVVMQAKARIRSVY